MASVTAHSAAGTRYTNRDAMPSMLTACWTLQCCSPPWHLFLAPAADAPTTAPHLLPSRIQREYFEKQAEAGRLATWQPPPPANHKTMRQTVGLPAYATQRPTDPDVAMGDILSRNMWTSNPGYVAREGSSMQGSTHRDYQWDAEAVSGGPWQLLLWVAGAGVQAAAICWMGGSMLCVTRVVVHEWLELGWDAVGGARRGVAAAAWTTAAAAHPRRRLCMHHSCKDVPASKPLTALHAATCG
jgi:hypothetical protein